MKAHEFLQSKEPNTFIVPVEWLDEYAKIVLNIAAEKAEIEYIAMCDCDGCIRIDIDSIINCLKD
jgi:hypothetical protein